MKSNILLLIISLIISLFFIELFSRFYYQGPVRQYDKRYIYKSIPNTTKTYKHVEGNGGAVIVSRINSKGFRGEEFKNIENSKRIVVYGDSFINAEYSKLEDTFVKQLEKKLSKENPFVVETINAGVNGYGPDQYGLRIEDEVDILHPSLIICSIFADNDFGDLIRNKIYRSDENQDLMKNNYVVAKDSNWWVVKIRTLRLINNLKPKIKKVILGRFKKEKIYKNNKKNANKVEGWLYKRELEYDEYKKNNVLSNMFLDGYDADIAITPESESAQYKINLMEKVILRIKNDLGKKNIPLMLLIIPSPIDVCDDYDLAQIDQDKYKNYKRSRLTDVVEEIAANHDILHLNLFRYFRNGDCNRLFFHYGNDHWNDKGQELAAELMANLIISNNFLE